MNYLSTIETIQTRRSIMSPHRPTFYGIDPDYIEAVTRKARKERAEAVRQLLAGVFPSVTDDRREALKPDNDLVHPTKQAA